MPSEDIHLILENDFEYFQAEPLYPARKDSFVDLLSNGKFVYDNNIQEINNIDLVEELNIEVCNFSETEPVKLLLDQYPDVNLFPKKVSNADIQYSRHLSNYIAYCNDNQLIGTLTKLERKKKIERYLQKKRKRTWVKKIHYDCRKKVAENRLRVKGRFVTKNKLILEDNDNKNDNQKDIN